MKKLLNCLLAVVMIISTTSSVFAINQDNTSINFVDNEGIEYFNEENSNASELKSFMVDGGIVIVNNEECIPTISEDELGIPFSIDESTTFNARQLSEDIGKDIATLYYKYGNNESGIYIINVGVDDDYSYNDLINEAVCEIRQQQTTENFLSSGDEPVLLSTHSATSIGVVTVTNTREPKGKLRASYNVYTVQDYNNLDYYVVKASVTGYPGYQLSNAGNSSYESKYEGETMFTSISTSSSSVTVDAYGPSRDISSSSSTYGVELGGSFDGTNVSGILGFSYSKTLNHSDTTVSTSGTTKSRSWDITLTGDAQRAFCDFYPGVTFVCPSKKASIGISVSASYELDSWNTATEIISLSRTITCTPTSA